jgi:hypothetical protein
MNKGVYNGTIEQKECGVCYPIFTVGVKRERECG